MPRGDKSSYTEKQKRKAQHIEEGYVERGVPREEAEQRAWATVNKQDGGGKLSGSGRARPGSKKTARKSAKKASKKAAAKASSKAGSKTARRAAKKSSHKRSSTKSKTTP